MEYDLKSDRTKFRVTEGIIMQGTYKKAVGKCGIILSPANHYSENITISMCNLTVSCHYTICRVCCYVVAYYNNMDQIQYIIILWY